MPLIGGQDTQSPKCLPAQARFELSQTTACNSYIATVREAQILHLKLLELSRIH
jgi:hypothetical protein